MTKNELLPAEITKKNTLSGYRQYFKLISKQPPF